MSKISKEEFERLLKAELPMSEWFGINLTEISEGRAVMELIYDEKLTRPGGTIAGPAMMALADAAMYAVVLSLIGKVELAVTTNLNINFLRKPANTNLVAEATMLKLGKRLAISEVSITSKDDDELVAHVTGTYSIPPR